jgi:hypothetical protein
VLFSEESGRDGLNLAQDDEFWARFQRRDQSIFTSTLNRTGQRSAVFLEEKPRWVWSLCKHQN